MTRAALLFILALAAPAAAQPAPAHKLELQYTQFTLPNGLRVILHEDHSVPMVTVNMWYHVGSARELPKRTGFAHLFEHLMFMGSGHVKPGEFDEWLEAAGGDNNGSTENDRTNYWINVPANSLELALFLESDRMGYLLDSMTPKAVDAQRDVVKNERRQSYENRPYGMAEILMGEMLYPEGHPYHWPVIGYMEDLSAASYDDVVAFFKKYYAPSNASLVVAGDLETASARKLIEKWFGDVKPAAAPEPMTIPGAELKGVQKKTITDRVQLPRLYLAWLTPRHFEPGDAALDIVADVLAGGKNSRLFKRLVYDMQIAQDVSASQQSQALSSSFQIVATPRPGHTVAELQKVIDEEIQKLQREPPTAHELERSVNQVESSFYNRMERVGGFGGTADQLNAYFTETGIPTGSTRICALPRAVGRRRHRRRRSVPAARSAGRTDRRAGEEAVAERKNRSGRGGPMCPPGPTRGSSPTRAHMSKHAPFVVVAAICASIALRAQAPDRSHPPQPGPPAPLRLPAIQKQKLSNGLPVWIVELHEVPVAQVNLIVLSGTANDPPGKHGVASLAAAMLEEGAGTRSALEIADAVDYLGADLGAATTSDLSAVRLHVPVARLADALPIMADVALRPTFPKDELDRQRQQRLTSLLQGRDDPATISSVAFSRILYGKGHRYGTPHGHGRNDQDAELRRSPGFYASAFRPENAVLLAVGDITAAQACRCSRKISAHGRRGPPPPKSCRRQTNRRRARSI
jgi:zinc protease